MHTLPLLPMLAVSVSNDTWNIMGQDSQVLTLTLKPQETAICEPGAMIACDDWIEAIATAGGGLWDWLVRYFWGGEKILQDQYTNASSSACQLLTLTVPFPGGKIIPVMLDKVTSMIISPGTWLASHGTDIRFDVSIVKSLYAGMFAGQGFVLPTISGTSPTFLVGGGTILERELQHRESITIDEKSFLACESTVEIRACRAGKLSMILFGGEGMFTCKLIGPGKVYLQSMPDRPKTLGIKKID